MIQSRFNAVSLGEKVEETLHDEPGRVSTYSRQMLVENKSI